MSKTSSENHLIIFEIILLCARIAPSSNQIDRLKELCLTLKEWNLVYDIALQHRIFPLVYKNLCKYCANTMPPETTEQGSVFYRNNGAKNLIMTGYLVRILVLLQKHNIPAIPFKGAVLAVRLYGDSALRSYCDIDLLIPQTYLPYAVKVLAEEDFLPTFSLTDQQLLKLAKTDNEYPLHHKTNGISLDLQWELTGGYFPSPILFENLFKTHKIIQIAGKNIPVFSDEDLLFYLCIHGNQHTWKQLDHICCIAGLIEKNHDLDWDAVFLTATNYKGTRILLIGLLLAQNMLSARIPEQFSNHLKQDRQAIRLAHQIASAMCSSKIAQKTAISHRFMRYHLLSMDNPLLAIRYLFRLLFLPTRYDWQRYPLPAHLSFLQYLIRPFRLAWEGTINLRKQ